MKRIVILVCICLISLVIVGCGQKTKPLSNEAMGEALAKEIINTSPKLHADTAALVGFNISTWTQNFGSNKSDLKARNEAMETIWKNIPNFDNTLYTSICDVKNGDDAITVMSSCEKTLGSLNDAKKTLPCFRIGAAIGFFYPTGSDVDISSYKEVDVKSLKFLLRVCQEAKIKPALTNEIQARLESAKKAKNYDEMSAALTGVGIWFTKAVHEIRVRKD